MQRILDQMPLPAYLRNNRFDVLAANDLGRALYSPLYEQAAVHTPGQPPNSARFCYLDPRATEFFSTTTRPPTTASRSCVPPPAEAFELAGDPGQRINVYTAPPDSPAEEALNLLASWTAPDTSAIHHDTKD
ncbi:hypothetical protein [Kribbella sp. NPDC048928]|uniref:MmyB family transcriptional regulator n=1 Tax=Kribbella sp. NPDC048928 TaxID=3364111 RepID=UPI00371AEC09